jgi:[DsrC]-trisulfide reductase subunit O
MSCKDVNISRRDFVGKTATAAAALTIAPGVFLQTVAQAKPADQAITSSIRWGMLIDTAKCANGCTSCVTACHTENGIASHDRPRTDQQWIRKVTLRDKQTKHEISLPMMCQHCESPPCVDVCPTGASMKRVDGIVLVDRHICIGCRYCMMACPYKARSFAHEATNVTVDYQPRGKGTVESCTMCVHRVDEGGTPACVEACAEAEHGAMIFGDIKNPDSEISKQLVEHGGKQIRADLGLNTGVRYRGI